jgi:hypothetical protein
LIPTGQDGFPLYSNNYEQYYQAPPEPRLIEDRPPESTRKISIKNRGRLALTSLFTIFLLIGSFIFIFFSGAVTSPPEEVSYAVAETDQDGYLHTVYTIHKGLFDTNSDYDIYYQKFSSSREPISEAHRITSYHVYSGDKDLEIPYQLILYDEKIFIFRKNFGNEKTNIYYIFSNDGGMTWSDSYTVETNGIKSSRFNIVSDENGLYLVFESKHNRISDVYFTKLVESPTSWSKPIPIAPVDGIDSRNSQITLYNDTLTICWEDEVDQSASRLNFGWHIYISESYDSGNTWTEPLLLEENHDDIAPIVYRNGETYLLFRSYRWYPHNPVIISIHDENGTQLGESNTIATNSKMLDINFKGVFYVLYSQDVSSPENDYQQKADLRLATISINGEKQSDIKLAESVQIPTGFLLEGNPVPSGAVWINKIEFRDQWKRNKLTFTKISSAVEAPDEVDLVKEGNTLIPEHVSMDVFLFYFFTPVFVSLILFTNLYYYFTQYDTKPLESKLLNKMVKHKKKILLIIRVMLIILAILIFFVPLLIILLPWLYIKIMLTVGLGLLYFGLPLALMVEHSLTIEDYIDVSWRLRKWRFLHNYMFLWLIIYFYSVSVIALNIYPFAFPYFLLLYYMLPVFSIFILTYLMRVKKYSNPPFSSYPSSDYITKLNLKNIEFILILIFTLLSSCAITAFSLTGT